MSAPRLLPSVEAQTVEFVEDARAADRPYSTELLHWSGFRVYLRYHRNYTVDDKVFGEVLTIAKVVVPEPLQRRGWFWRYCQLCLALVDDAVVVENVFNPHLYAALERRKGFQLLSSKVFVMHKQRPDDESLKFDKPASDH